MRIINNLLLVCVMLLVVGIVRAGAAEKKIGVFMFSGENRYLEALQGFKARLAESGFGEKQVIYYVENAGGNKAKADEIVKKLSAQKFDLIHSLGTSATVPLSRQIKDVPIVFSSVYDPVKAGIAKSWKSSENNTTGCSPFIQMSKQLDILKKFAPVKRLAILYTPGEKNSEAQLRDLLELQEKHQIKMIPIRLTKIEEIAQLLPEVLRTSDALFLTGSNLVTAQAVSIVDMANKAKIVTISHLEDLVEKGVLMGVSADTFALGGIAADKAVKIFKGARPSSIPIDTATKIDVLLNMKSVRKGSFAVPAEFMKSVTKKVE